MEGTGVNARAGALNRGAGRPLRPCVNICTATGQIGKEGKIGEDNGAVKELGNVQKAE